MEDASSISKQWRAREVGPADKRVYLGEVSVDGAELFVVDPVHLPSRCDELVDEIHSDLTWVGVGRGVLRNPHNPGEYLAMLLRLESDGGYPIWAERSSDGHVLRYTIEVEPPQEEGD